MVLRIAGGCMREHFGQANRFSTGCEGLVRATQIVQVHTQPERANGLRAQVFGVVGILATQAVEEIECARRTWLSAAALAESHLDRGDQSKRTRGVEADGRVIRIILLQGLLVEGDASST